MSDVQGEMLERAIANGALGKFLVGEEPYFYSEKNDNEDPQNILAAFRMEVVPCLSRPGSENVLARLFSELESLLQKHPDKNRAIYCAIGWMFAYAYYSHEKKAENKPWLEGLPETDAKPLARLTKQILESNKGNLLADTRWAGATWNSGAGLWEPLMRTAEATKTRYNGPDFVPDNQ